ncbi:MAG: potassium channel family protein, partial [Terracidiphilus sp.]
MERQTQDLPTWVLVIISPTRVLFEVLKDIKIQRWTTLFLALNTTFLFCLPFIRRHLPFWHGLVALIWVLPFSRVVEIGYAFYNDTFDQLRRVPLRTELDRVQRFKLLGRSYIEVAICYASLYLSLPWCRFNTPPSSGFEALYFSWVTITTTGYGDILPQGPLARALCMTEIGIGLMLLVFAVGTYFSFEERHSRRAALEPAAEQHTGMDQEVQTQEHATKPKRERFGASLASHRRALILLGAIMMLATYFLKDVANEGTKEKIAAISAGTSAYLASMPSLQEQLNELANTSQILNGKAPAVPRVKILISMGDLSLRAQTNSLQLSALVKSMRDAPEPKLVEVRDILDRTTHVTDDANEFLGRTSSDSDAFQTSAKLLIGKFQALENEVGKAGADLYSFERT